jgi:hypothetical protein
VEDNGLTLGSMNNIRMVGVSPEIHSYILYSIDPFWLNDVTGCRTCEST